MFVPGLVPAYCTNTMYAHTRSCTDTDDVLLLRYCHQKFRTLDFPLALCQWPLLQGESRLWLPRQLTARTLALRILETGQFFSSVLFQTLL